MPLSLATITASDLSSVDPAASRRVRTALRAAFCGAGPGVISVTGLPSWYTGARRALFASGRRLSALPESVLARYERPAADYAVGWSRGRERFRGAADVGKGSFYANAVADAPADAARGARYVHLLAPNVWPRDEGRANVEVPFKQVCGLVVELGARLAWHCDRLVEEVAGVEDFSVMEGIMRESQAHKGRLLHYYPLDAEEGEGGEGGEGDGMWCGFHNDHGLLTGLVCAEYYNERTRGVLRGAPDARAGLQVARGAADAPARVAFPQDALAFQVGETAQILSGGVLRAVPHAVRGVARDAEDVGSVSRSSMAVFLQPDPEFALALPEWDVKGVMATKFSARVPPLGKRFVVGDQFHAFAAKTIQAYVVDDGAVC